MNIIHHTSSKQNIFDGKKCNTKPEKAVDTGVTEEFDEAQPCAPINKHSNNNPHKIPDVPNKELRELYPKEYNPLLVQMQPHWGKSIGTPWKDKTKKGIPREVGICMSFELFRIFTFVMDYLLRRVWQRLLPSEVTSKSTKWMLTLMQ